MEDNKPLSDLNVEALQAAEATRASAHPDPATPAQPEAPKMTAKQRKQMKEQQKNFAKMFQNYEERRVRMAKKLLQESKRMKDLIGRADYNMLKDICTIHTPEQKNEAGEVTVKASSFVNHKALIEEAKLALVLQREQRIKDGKRKRSTGRGSDRSTHVATMNFINMRNEDTLKKEPLANTPHLS